MLVRHITDLNDADLIGSETIDLSKDQKAQLNDYIKQRLAGRPISKIIGIKEFYGRDFIVNDDVLDPRPDSELIIDTILRHCEPPIESGDKLREAIQNSGDINNSGLPQSLPLLRNDGLKILDLGTGSGCLILTLLAELPNAKGVATDISDEALSVARQNAKALGVHERVQFIKSDWFENVTGTYDIIISNPPYINSDVIPNLDKNVRDYDPILALDGGGDGLDPYKMILPQVKKYLTTGGMVALEHGHDQAARIKRLIENAGLYDIKGHQDLGRLDRILTAIHK